RALVKLKASANRLHPIHALLNHRMTWLRTLKPGLIESWETAEKLGLQWIDIVDLAQDTSTAFPLDEQTKADVSIKIFPESFYENGASAFLHHLHSRFPFAELVYIDG